MAELKDIQTTSQNARDAMRFSRGYLQAQRLLRKLSPDVIFTKGGYVTVPMGLAASRRNIPLVIHESDTIFGMSTRMLAPRAEQIATGFPETAFIDSPYHTKITFTGNPVRKSLLSGSMSRAKKTFALDNTKPVVLIFAGSQGAHAINEVVFSNLPLILKQYNLIHQTGEQDIEQARIAAHNLPQQLKGRYRPYDFLHTELADALFYSDVVIARAGAGSIAEVAAHSKPLILVPSPYSANDHQLQNAKFLERMGAARIIEQTDLTPIRMSSEVSRILSQPKAKKYLQASIHELWIPDAAERIARLILDTSGKAL